MRSRHQARYVVLSGLLVLAVDEDLVVAVHDDRVLDLQLGGLVILQILRIFQLQPIGSSALEQGYIEVLRPLYCSRKVIQCILFHCAYTFPTRRTSRMPWRWRGGKGQRWFFL